MINLQQKEYLREAGIFTVRVVKTLKTNSKKGNPMLVVTFSDPKEREINAYFVANNQWGLEKLSKCKAALGLVDTAKAEDMIGKSCQIEVAFQDPNKTGGKIYTEITTYSPVIDDFNTHAESLSVVGEEEKLPW